MNLDMGRAFTEARERAGNAVKNGGNGIEIAAALSRDVDALVIQAAGPEVAKCQTPVAIFATGGFGRLELAPHSDLDLLVLCGKTPGADVQALAEAIRSRDPGQSLVEAMHGLHAKECGRLASPGFAHFAGAIAASPALQAKEMEVMGQFTDHLAATIREELTLHPADAQIAANLLMSVHWQFFRNAREHALAGCSGPTAVRRLRKDLERAYRLLEHGLGALDGGREASAG